MDPNQGDRPLVVRGSKDHNPPSRFQQETDQIKIITTEIITLLAGILFVFTYLSSSNTPPQREEGNIATAACSWNLESVLVSAPGPSEGSSQDEGHQCLVPAASLQ